MTESLYRLNHLAVRGIETDGLLDIKESGSLEPSRIADAAQAQAIVVAQINDDAKYRAKRRTRVAGKIDGNAPVSPQKLRDANRSEDSNLNWREAKGHILNAWTPYFDLVCEVPVCIQADMEFADPSTDQDALRGFCEAFHKMLFGWRGFDRVTQLKDWQMLVHGIGSWIWQDEWCPFPKAPLYGNILVSEDTESDFDNGELLTVRTVMNSGSLWKQINDEAAATAMGWNVQAVRETIMNADRTTTGGYQQWEEVQRAYQRGDLYLSNTQTKKINLAHLYAQELDGGISQYVVAESDQPGSETKFLFKKRNRFESWEQCICPFPYDVGADGSWHSVKGLGTEIFPFCELSDRIKNAITDSVLLGTRPMFQAGTAMDAQKMKLVRFGGYNLMPPGLNPMQLFIQNSIEPALAVSREMESALRNNTGTYKQAEPMPDRVAQTAKEYTLRAMDQAKLTKGAHNRYYRSLDRGYSEIWRRACNPAIRPHHPGGKAAVEFHEKCKKICEKLQIKDWRGALKSVENVRAYRSLGLGSAAMRIEIANALMEKWPMYDEVGKNNALRAFVSTLTSYSSVDAFAPSITTGEIPTEDDSIAALENNALNTGGQVIITPRQNHAIHLKIHVESMEEDAQSLDQGGDIADVFQRLEAKGAHSHEHLAKLSQNPLRKEDVAQYSQRLQQLAAIQDKLQQHLEEMANNQQPPPDQPDPEVMKVQGGLQLQAAKLQGEQGLKSQKLAQDEERKNTKLRADLRRKDLTAAASIKRTNGNGMR